MKLDNLKLEVKGLRDEINKVSVELNRKLKELLNLKSNETVANVSIYYDYRTEEQKVEIRTSINIVENEKNIFGHGLDLNYYEGVLNINHGSMGSYDKKDVTRIQLANLIANVANNLQAIESLYLDYINNGLNDLIIKEHELELEIMILERKAQEEKRLAVEEAFLKALEFDKDYEIPEQHIKSRRRDLYKINSIKFLKRLPKGDFKVEITTEDWSGNYNWKIETYITLHEAMNIKGLIKKGS